MMDVDAVEKDLALIQQLMDELMQTPVGELADLSTDVQNALVRIYDQVGENDEVES